MLLRIDSAALLCYSMGEGSGSPRVRVLRLHGLRVFRARLENHNIESHRVSTPKKRFFAQSFRLDSVNRGDISGEFCQGE